MFSQRFLHSFVGSSLQFAHRLPTIFVEQVQRAKKERTARQTHQATKAKHEAKRPSNLFVGGGREPAA
jgi:hypothetical protein